MRRMMMKRAASAVVLVAMMGAGLAFSTGTDPCRQAYLESGLTAQQMSFDEFHGFYSDTLCASSGDAPVATTGAQVPKETR
jgi:hypothetical protein